jgi:putative transposase
LNLQEWLILVNQPQNEKELALLRLSMERGTPFGSEDWSGRMIESHGLHRVLRSRGRPRK